MSTDNRTWVPAKGHTLTGRVWNRWYSNDAKRWNTAQLDAVDLYPLSQNDFVMPFYNTDVVDGSNLPPLPDEVSSAGKDDQVVFRGYPPSSLVPTTAPEPSRLEILKDMVKLFYQDWDGEACTGTTKEEIAAEQAAWRARLINTAVVWTDEIIAAARKSGAS